MKFFSLLLHRLRRLLEDRRESEAELRQQLDAFAKLKLANGKWTKLDAD